MDWLTISSIVSLTLAAVSFVIILVDLLMGHAQRMAVMNLVWPTTALYAGPLALWAYFTIGRSSLQKPTQPGMTGHGQQRKPFWQMAMVGATHCGSGCTLGDLMAEWAVVAVPITFLGQKIFGTWLLDFVLAFLFGIAFQYFSIKPMRHLSPAQGLWAALKADTLSLTAWQFGMYGWMALVIFGLFRHELPKTNPVFWFMMQIAMLVGFVTSYPVNWWLLKTGIKEAM